MVQGAGMSEGAPYLPFEGGHPGFRIALKPLDPAQWIEPDEGLAERLAEKDRLSAADPEGTFRAGDGTLSVTPANEYDGDVSEIVHEVDPFAP